MSRSWYRVEVNAGPETFCVFGSSALSEKEFISGLNAGSMLLLEDLVYYDEEGNPRSWSDWDPHCHPRMYLHPNHVISVMPMMGDPRTMDGQVKILNLPRFMRDPE